jgi:hypothetical protein
MSSVIVGSDNSEERIKELEKTVAGLSKEIKDLSLDSVIEYNYQITKFSWLLTGTIFSALLTARDRNGVRNLCALISYVAISSIVTLPVDYYVRNYLLKKVKMKKKDKNKKNNREIMA